MISDSISANDRTAPLTHQQLVSRAQGRVSELQATLSKAQELALRAAKALPDLAGLDAEHELLKRSVAEFLADPKALDEVTRRVREAHAAAEPAHQALEQANRTVRDASTELRTAQNALQWLLLHPAAESTTGSVAYCALIAHQDLMSAKRLRIASLASKEREEAGLIALLEQKCPDLSDLDRERRDILAKIALGEMTEADLDAHDEQAGPTYAAASDIANQIERKADTIAGLRSQREAEQEPLREMQAQHGILLRRYLMSEAESVGEHYAMAAATLAQHFQRLRVLDTLLVEQGHRPSIQQHGPSLHIPGFMLDSCRPYVAPNPPHAIFHQTQDGHAVMAWRAGELSRLKDAGIQFD